MGVVAVTAWVETVACPDVAPAAIVKIVPATTAGLELESATETPPAGAAAESVADTVTLPPPVTDVGATVRDDTCGNGAGFTVSGALAEPPLAEAAKVIGVVAVTAWVATVACPDVAPGATVKVVPATTAGLELESATETPPAGAAADSVAETVTLLPPVTDVGATVRELTCTELPGVRVRSAAFCAVV
jgi:hypothetical protein